MKGRGATGIVVRIHVCPRCDQTSDVFRVVPFRGVVQGSCTSGCSKHNEEHGGERSQGVVSWRLVSFGSGAPRRGASLLSGRRNRGLYRIVPKAALEEEIGVSNLGGKDDKRPRSDAHGPGSDGTHVTAASEEVTAALGTIRYNPRRMPWNWEGVHRGGGAVLLVIALSARVEVQVERAPPRGARPWHGPTVEVRSDEVMRQSEAARAARPGWAPWRSPPSPVPRRSRAGCRRQCRPREARTAASEPCCWKRGPLRSLWNASMPGPRKGRIEAEFS